MIIGIDLGTTNSLAACFRDGVVEVIPNRLGKHLTPSVVSVDENDVVYVGETARERGYLRPLETARTFKRSMGTDREFVLGSRTFSAEELSGMVLRSLKEDAEEYLGEPVDEAIVSVPAYFNDLQRKATVRAGELAGLKVSRIVNEPTAAAIACGMGGTDARYLVFDLGGGTFDVSILELVGPIMEVHSIAGDTYLGGEDFTTLLVDLFLEDAGVSLSELDARGKAELSKAAEEAKRAFASEPFAVMACPVGAENHVMILTLEDYETACQPLLERLRKPIERSLRDAHIKLDEIDQVVLVGGATRLPVVRRFVERLFDRKVETLVDPDEAVVTGAALQCGMKERNAEIREVVLTDVCPFTLGTEVRASNGAFKEAGHYLPIIERNTTIPVSRTQTVVNAYDDQSHVEVRVLQGESRLAKNNLELGRLVVPIPRGPEGSQSVDITYTYDVNSLLEVEVHVQSTGLRRRMVLQNERQRLPDDEVERRMELLSYLKQNPRDEEANRLQILRGERMYEESAGEQRQLIDQAMLEFDKALASQDRMVIAQARQKLKELLDSLDL